MVSAGIKFPKGIINFGTLVYDAATGDGLDVDQSVTERFNRAFDKTIFGIIENQAEEDARATAAGHLTEAFLQIFNAAKVGTKVLGPGIEYASRKARQLAPALVKAVKTNRYGKLDDTATSVSKAGKKAKDLNAPNRFDKFVAVSIGGGFGGGAIVMKSEDIGTFGDINALEFLGTGLDREQKKSANDDAFRQLNNKFKFSAELAFPIVPFVYGVGKTAKLLATKGKDLAFSNSQIERWVDKYVGKPFRSRSDKAQELFDGIQKLEGKKSAIKITADDAAKSFDDELKKISKNSTKASEAIQNPLQLSELFSNFLLSTDDVVKKGRIVFQGFSDKSLKAFRKSMNELGVNKQNIDELISNGIDFRTVAATLKNTIAQGKNYNVAVEELNTILNNRVKYNLGSDYKIFDMNMGLFDGFKPTLGAKEDVAKIIQRYHINNGEKGFSMDDAMIVVNNILKRVTKDPVTGTPQFPIGTANILDDSAVQIKSMSENVTAGGKFKADKVGGLIQTKSDLAAFNSLFGKYKNAKNTIDNVMTDLADIVSRDKFYSQLLADSEALLARGERPLFYKTYNEALKNLPYQEIIRRPLKLSTRLSDQVYSSPLDGLFTSKAWAESIRTGDEIIGSALTRSLPYRAMLLIPKGISQAGKTILGPFTHLRNFFSAVFTTVHSGNILIPPQKLFEFFSQAVKSAQPQLLYRATGNPRFRNTPQDQGLYQFLLEEGVVNQNVVARDIEGLFGDITRAGKSNETAEVFFNKLVNSTTSKFKKLYGVAQDLYTAEDDVFRITNFLAEGYKYKEAYKQALKDGIIKSMPSDLEIMKQAAKIVRETVPNYAYVSDFVKGIRRSPLGSFASFPSEIFRTGGNTTMRALFEVKDPIRETIGMKRLVGQALTYAFFPIAAMKAGSALYGITRDKITAMREILPVWSEDNTIIGVYEDGKYKYIDFSHGFFYDTMIQPVQTTLATVQRDPNAPLVPQLLDGMVKSTAKVFEPFIQESIWTGVVLDIFARNGRTKEGRQIWNERMSPGDKFAAAVQYAAKELSPGSREQLVRLYKALTDQTVKGTKYEIPDELMGLFGFRKVPLDLEKTLNFRIQEFKRDERNERNLIYRGTRTGDPIKDENQIIRQYIEANKQRLETYNKMRRLYDAVKVLGLRDKKIAEEFDDRGAINLYSFIEDNKFKPFSISDNVIAAYAKESEEKNIPNPLNNRVLKQLGKIEDKLYKQKLNQPFIINEEDYLLEESNTSMVPPLPEQPMPNAAIVQSPPPVTQTGLTMMEQALLSEEEKMITLKNRGLA